MHASGLNPKPATAWACMTRGLHIDAHMPKRHRQTCEEFEVGVGGGGGVKACLQPAAGNISAHLMV